MWNIGNTFQPVDKSLRFWFGFCWFRTNLVSLSFYSTVVFSSFLVTHAPQYFPTDSNQLLLPGPTALENISMPSVSLAHSHHTPAGPHQLHPGLSPFMSNSSYNTTSRGSLDMDLTHKENDRSKCIQAPGISLHPSWNTLGQAWTL